VWHIHRKSWIKVYWHGFQKPSVLQPTWLKKADIRASIEFSVRNFFNNNKTSKALLKQNTKKSCPVFCFNCYHLPIMPHWADREVRGGREADSAHHFETPVRACFEISTSFEIMHLIRYEIRPRIQKMKCLAPKLTKWRKIEKLWWKCEIERYLKIERFALFKSCYQPSTKWLPFSLGWSDFADTGLYGFLITNG